jgi:serine/threonine protein kinase
MPRLEIAAQGRIQVVVFDAPQMTIGRQEGNAIVLADEKASRYHCILEQQDGVVRLRDFKSQNGTWLGKEKIAERILGIGDTFRIGQTFIRLVPDVEQVCEVESHSGEQPQTVDSGDQPGLTRIQALFENMLAEPLHNRPALLARACGGDDKLKSEVEALLIHHDEAGASFLKPGRLVGSTPEGSFDVVPAPALSIGTDETALLLQKNPDFTGIEQTRVPTNLITGYTIVREVHRGGQGIVYQAIQKGTHRKVAIKVLLEGPYASRSARQRFAREIEIIARLQHPNIVEIFHSGQAADGRPYCVMNYVRGLPLNQYAREKKLPLEDALQLFSKVCEAVDYAHERGVIHRDLKPNNILVDSEGTPKVLDFGLAKQLAGPDVTMLSLTGQVVGTLPYMSPEQVRGNPGEIDGRTDVYALGVILYELLTGQYPYPVTGQVVDVIRHIAETLPTPPSRTWNRDSGILPRANKKLKLGACPINDELQTIVMRALCKERVRRYKSAGELGRDVVHYLKGEPIEARRDSAFYLLRNKLHRYRIPLSAVAIFLLILAALIISVSYNFLRGPL